MVDRFEEELKQNYENEHEFWDDYFCMRDEYYNELENNEYD